MKRLFYIGLFALAVFEIAKVYFIMPMPGSQQLNTIDLAYFIHAYRWAFRIVLVLITLAGIRNAFSTKRKWIPIASIACVLGITYLFNFIMMADKMFVEPLTLSFKGRSETELSDSTLVIAIEHEGEAKAYPIRYIVYHHQVRDTVGNKQVMVTYCSVCRTGRVFEPLVNGQPETFRLVGMDHFNAMFEDTKTKSWWRQVTGEAIAGSLKGEVLPEFPSNQITLQKFFTLYPFGKVMQAELVSREKYDSLGKFEKGKSKSKLTGTDSAQWKDKSWVLGVQVGSASKAYDWKDLVSEKIIHDKIGDTPIVILLAEDGLSFTAFERNPDQYFKVSNDTLTSEQEKFTFTGQSINQAKNLKKVSVYQEFWHSWKTFHPNTDTYK